jgi:hypothetical protein
VIFREEKIIGRNLKIMGQFKFSIDRLLSNENYDLWTLKLEMVLTKEDLSSVVEDDLLTTESEAWKKKNGKELWPEAHLEFWRPNKSQKFYINLAI